MFQANVQLQSVAKTLRLVSIAAIIVGALSSMVIQIDAGMVGVKSLFGKVNDKVLESGLHLINPLTKIHELDARTQNYTMSGVHDEGDKSGDDAIRVLSSDGLEVTIDLTVLYRIIPAEAPKIIREIGREYQSVIVRPITRTKIRDNAVYYNAVDLYSTKREEFQGRIFKDISAEFKARGLELEELLVRNINLPESVKLTIESKINAEQEAQKMAFVLQKEKFDKRVFLLSIKTFVKYLQLSQNEHAPETNIEALIFNQDYPRRTNKKDKTVKYIEDEILEQLENNLDKLTPAKYIPVIILLRASGWRISDVLNLRYDNCLSKTKNGYFLSGDIQKTQVLEHKIPISDEIVAIVKDCIESTKSNKYNKDKYLFCSKDGKRKGLPYSSENIQDSLNRFAKNYNITDIDGNIFRFKTHAFRHTKAVELINNGMNLLHVQKWLAHLTPVMTLHYAKILDNTMRKSWEEATKDGMFKLDGTGKALKVELSDISDEDIIEWEWIKHNLDAVRMPLGYCMKPNKMECATQLNPCLTCRSLCTTPEFIPAFEQEIYQTKEIINKGKSQNRTFWVEKNELLLNKLESVLSVLKGGKIKHDAGKQGREYVGEQRK